MIRIIAIAVLACATTAPVAAQDVAHQACQEAVSETLKAGTPKTLRSTVQKVCLAAFADKSHRLNAEAACDRQARKQKANDRLLVAYTCMTAMSIAYE